MKTRRIKMKTRVFTMLLSVVMLAMAITPTIAYADNAEKEAFAFHRVQEIVLGEYEVNPGTNGTITEECPLIEEFTFNGERHDYIYTYNGNNVILGVRVTDVNGNPMTSGYIFVDFVEYGSDEATYSMIVFGDGDSHTTDAIPIKYGRNYRACFTCGINQNSYVYKVRFVAVVY